jgi:hypothetical protein
VPSADERTHLNIDGNYFEELTIFISGFNLEEFVQKFEDSIPESESVPKNPFVIAHSPAVERDSSRHWPGLICKFMRKCISNCNYSLDDSLVRV